MLPKQFATDALKTTSKRVIQKTTEATGDLIYNTLQIKLQKSQEVRRKTFQPVTNEEENTGLDR